MEAGDAGGANALKAAVEELEALREIVGSGAPTTRPSADHGEFGLLHGEMLGQFSRWEDEITLREFGFRISKLSEMEMLVARYTTSDTLTPEGEMERDRIIAEYKAVWRPRRLQMRDF